MIGGSRRAGIPRIFASPKIDVGGVRSEGGLVEIARELTKGPSTNQKFRVFHGTLTPPPSTSADGAKNGFLKHFSRF